MLAVASLLIVTLQANQASSVETFHFPSNALGRKMSFCAVLPPGYAAGEEREWPFLLLLHGRGRNRESLLKDPTTRQALDNLPFVVLLPDGEDGWYIDSLVKPAAKYESHLEELLAFAEKRLSLSKDPRQRAITGWSMGGYGAVRFAQRHAEQFHVVTSIIGLLDFPRTGLPIGQSYEVPTACFGADPHRWPDYNPLKAADRLRGRAVMIVTADRAFDRTMNHNFAEELRRLGIEHQFHELAGGHTFPVVGQALPLVMSFVTEQLKLPVNSPQQISM